jgi:hypothetical protein
VPELDVLPDEEGQALVDGLAAQAEARGEWVLSRRVNYALIAATALFYALVGYVFDTFGPAAGLGMLAFAVAAIVGGTRFLGLKEPRRRSLRAQVNDRLRDDWCQRCNYPLHELPACTGPMECPRCRRPCIARESIRTAADLLACDVDAYAERLRLERRVVERCECGYPLSGLPVDHGGVRCPECGEGYAVRGSGFVRTA